ncbi:hypothetical protein H9P43_002966 [Blastocladiella emersonii ATCC 22665]|nr:hypothetical protein H9P43_002966 [Blastocladiella emersonii ATCC 22665]
MIALVLSSQMHQSLNKMLKVRHSTTSRVKSPRVKLDMTEAAALLWFRPDVPPTVVPGGPEFLAHAARLIMARTDSGLLEPSVPVTIPFAIAGGRRAVASEKRKQYAPLYAATDPDHQYLPSGNFCNVALYISACRTTSRPSSSSRPSCCSSRDEFERTEAKVNVGGIWDRSSRFLEGTFRRLQLRDLGAPGLSDDPARRGAAKAQDLRDLRRAFGNICINHGTRHAAPTINYGSSLRQLFDAASNMNIMD